MSDPTKREGPLVPRPSRPPRFEPKPGLLVAGKYRVERVIGEGGMGVVVAGTHEGLEQKVAIKFLAPEAMRNPEAVERFLREAKVAAKVRSEHVARVTDVGRVEGGPPFLVMEYLEGRDLGQAIAAGGALPVEEVCEIGLQACEALAEVHAAGIVHRDLKPSNLFVTRRADDSPCVKLLDFGISKLTVAEGDEMGDPALTRTTTIMGSPSYMSPEQLKSTKDVDARTDVWSLGAALYEALTGKPAFRGESMPAVCAMIASEEPAPPSSLRGEVPPELERAILACLVKKPEARGTLVDLARALAPFAPERARASLERLEATMGAERSHRSLSRLDAGEAAASLPVVVRGATVGDVGARTQASWGEERGGKRGGGGLLLGIALGAAGAVGLAVYTGAIGLKAGAGPLASAARAAAAVTVTGAAAVPGAPAAAASSAPPAASVPAPVAAAATGADASAEPADASAEGDDADDAEPDAPAPQPLATAAPASPHPWSPPHPSAPKRSAPRPHHGGKGVVPHKHR